MLKERTWKRIAAGLAAIALTAVNAGATFAGSTGVIAYAAQQTAITAEESKDTVPGGWAFSDIAAGTVEKADKEALDAALSELTGVTYEAKDVIATQTVAGKNLAFLCKATPVVPDAKSYWAIVSVYVDLQGKSTLNNIAAVDPAEMKVKANADEPAPGSWESAAKDKTAKLPESVQKAVSGVMGVSYAPIAVLGTQIVAGKNYCILAYGTTVTANPVTNLYAIYVYEKLDGTAEVSAISALDLAAYVTPETITIAGDLNGDGKVNLKDVTILRRYIAGGWGIELDETTADLNGDGKINLKDVTLLRRFIAGGWDVTL